MAALWADELVLCTGGECLWESTGFPTACLCVCNSGVDSWASSGAAPSDTQQGVCSQYLAQEGLHRWLPPSALTSGWRLALLTPPK